MGNFVKTIRTASLATLSCFALMDESHGEGFYSGINIGSSEFDVIQFGESETGWGAYLGFDFNRHIGVEVSYTDYEEFRSSRSPRQLLLNPSAISLTGIVKYPILNRLEIYAKAGYTKIDIEADSTNPFYVYHGSRGENGAIYGIGFNYLISESWDVRLGADRTQIDLGNILAGGVYSKAAGHLDIVFLGLTRQF